VAYRFGKSRPRQRALSGVLPERDRQGVETGLGVVVGNQFGLFTGGSGEPSFQNLGYPLMVLLSSILEQRLIGRVLNQGVPEHVLCVRGDPTAVEYRGVHELGERRLQVLFFTRGHSFEKIVRKFSA
jgi:hypothetical protein